jgi:4-deoxy-L-threo-5-hexosulose-uronate ketol-isomerase
MEIRFASHPNDVKHYTTEQLREHFLIGQVFVPGKIAAVYSMYDRMVTAGAMPLDAPLSMPAYADATKAEYFLQRREMGIINVGHTGKVTVDGESFELRFQDCLYIGRGKKEIVFESENTNRPAEFYINSTPAHREFPTVKASVSDANPVELGAKETCNERTIFQYIHEKGIQSCQLVMGFTRLKSGNVWNTFPPHTHTRRMEVYCYFNLPEDQLVMHFMGQPQETRHLVMRNKQAVIAPEWSIHSGAGTSAYSFIWAMGGENQAFTDMDPAGIQNLK